MKKRALSLSIALALLSVSAAQAAQWQQLNLNQPSNIDPNVTYSGSFDFNGHTYGPDNARKVNGQASSNVEHTFDLTQLKADTLYGKNNGNLGKNDVVLKSNDNSFSNGAPVVYRMYRQQYSAAVVNLSRGTESRHFVKSVVGEKTAPDTLVNGTYNYQGVTFTNFPRGDFNYQVNVTGPSSATGQGKFNLNDIKIPAGQSSTGKDVFFDIAGNLDKTNLVKAGGGLVFQGGVSGVSATNNSAWREIGGPAAAAEYQLTLYGPGGREIAGSIQGLPDRIGSVAVIGKRK
ncbi:hypothetical protein [Carnimonas bestiolae]|uniref:hypothetical protein n=1 Tax=Carnimonas bestiolae TaxID=3402172 RepID=UPI003EDC2F69